MVWEKTGIEKCRELVNYWLPASRFSFGVSLDWSVAAKQCSLDWSSQETRHNAGHATGNRKENE